MVVIDGTAAKATELRDLYRGGRHGRADRIHKRERSLQKAGALNPMALISLFAIVVTSMGLGYIMQKTQIAGATYDIAMLEEEIKELEIERDRLQLSIMRLQSLDRVETVARERLDMVRPESIRFIYSGDSLLADAETVENTDGLLSMGAGAAAMKRVLEIFTGSLSAVIATCVGSSGDPLV